MADKSLPRRMYENVMGTPEQNAEAEKRMEERDKKNPGKKKGGYVKAADGCCTKGKTKGRMV